VASMPIIALISEGFAAERNINLDATLRLKCVRAHFTGENPLYGILEGDGDGGIIRILLSAMTLLDCLYRPPQGWPKFIGELSLQLN
jgi:hypothetical protein